MYGYNAEEFWSSIGVILVSFIAILVYFYSGPSTIFYTLFVIAAILMAYLFYKTKSNEGEATLSKIKTKNIKSKKSVKNKR